MDHVLVTLINESHYYAATVFRSVIGIEPAL